MTDYFTEILHRYKQNESSDEESLLVEARLHSHLYFTLTLENELDFSGTFPAYNQCN